MMLPTHAFAGMALALPYALAMPEAGTVPLVAGLLGGVVPDLDMYAGHRKTLHYPVYYSVLAVVAVPVAGTVPTLAAAAAACFLLGAATHSVTDIFGGGLELRPWEATSDRAVYDHHRDRWLAPRRWVRYDGAPEDLLVSIVLAVPLLFVLDGALEWITLSLLAVAGVYTAVRRLLPAVVCLLIDGLDVPNRLLARVPARYLEGEAERVPVIAADDR